MLSFGLTGEVTWRDVVLDDLGRPSFRLGHGGVWVPVALATSGVHQVANAAAAAAMALAVGEPLAALGPRLSAAVPSSPWRMSPSVRPDGLVVIDDSYNANPESMAAALRGLVAIGGRRPGRTVAVLGEMRELGPDSPAAHRQLTELAGALGVDEVMAVAAPAYGGRDAASREEALAWLRAELRPEDTVLVKASRAAALDRLAAQLLNG